MPLLGKITPVSGVLVMIEPHDRWGIVDVSSKCGLDGTLILNENMHA